MNDKDLYWLAGWLEGEGSFVKGPPSNPTGLAISGVSTDIDTIARVADLLDTKFYKTAKAKDYYKDAYTACIKHQKARDLMIILRPLMSVRRQSQIDNALSTRLSIRHAISKETTLEMLNLYNSGIKQSAIALQFNFSREAVNKAISRLKRSMV